MFGNFLSVGPAQQITENYPICKLSQRNILCICFASSIPRNTSGNNFQRHGIHHQLVSRSGSHLYRDAFAEALGSGVVGTPPNLRDDAEGRFSEVMQEKLTFRTTRCFTPGHLRLRAKLSRTRLSIRDSGVSGQRVL